MILSDLNKYTHTHTKPFWGHFIDLHAIADNVHVLCYMCVSLTSFQIDAAGDRQVPFAEIAQEAAEGSVVAGQCVCMQVV